MRPAITTSEREHDRLVEREQELATRERELHLEQGLAFVAPNACDASTDSPVTPRMPSAVMRTAGGWRR